MGNKFHDTDLSSTVKNAFQALAIDEKRRNFKATLWNQPAQSKDQTLEQVWFIGVHSNVGGGYPSTGLSDVALEWMRIKAKSCNLSMEAIPDCNPDYMDIPEESWKGFYRLIPKYYRYVMKTKFGNEALHDSVTKRLKEDNNYRPKNLKSFFP